MPGDGQQFAIESRMLLHRVAPIPGSEVPLFDRSPSLYHDREQAQNFTHGSVDLVSLSIMRRFTFCAGHRLVGHEGKCQNLHGHNYVVEIYVTGREQDEVGRILDFKLLKEKCKGWLDENWDHTFILWNKDHNGLDAIRRSEPHRIYELDANPTAENMAIHLLQDVCPKILIGTGAAAFKVRLWESEETCAEVSTK